MSRDEYASQLDPSGTALSPVLHVFPRDERAEHRLDRAHECWCEPMLRCYGYARAFVHTSREDRLPPELGDIVGSAR